MAAGGAATGERMKMKPHERMVWLLQWVKKYRFADVLNSDLVDDYEHATGAKVDVVPWGANKCPQLGRDLAYMAKCGALKRWRNGLSGGWQPGFPTWVWSYEIGNAAYLFEEQVSA